MLSAVSFGRLGAKSWDGSPFPKPACSWLTCGNFLSRSRPTFASIMAGRALGGLLSAGGSVTLGMIVDMWESDNQQYAVAFVVFSFHSRAGCRGFVEQFLNWRWNI
jgi:hypothetical protein